jgi:hypothetical protein
MPRQGAAHTGAAVGRAERREELWVATRQDGGMRPTPCAVTGAAVGRAERREELWVAT